MDVVGINHGGRGDGVDVFLQTATGTLADPVTYHENHGGFDEVDVGDVNGDGRTDIVVMSGSGYAAPNIGVLPQKADGTMDAPVYYSVGFQITTQGVGVGDVNGDGLSDIVVSYGGNRPGSFIGRFLQNTQQTLDPAVSYPSYEIPSPVVVADVDSDGRKDVLVVHKAWLRLGVYRQTAAGNLGAEEPPIASGDGFQPQGLAVGDINGDGLPDVVFADNHVGLVKLLHVDDVPPKVAGHGARGRDLLPERADRDGLDGERQRGAGRVRRVGLAGRGRDVWSAGRLHGPARGGAHLHLDALGPRGGHAPPRHGA